ncbi:MAG: aspartate/glutamate racemase family protein, partial [Lachnospiraceae bacterium]
GRRCFEMKKIGLVGGTSPESTLIYYKELNRRINERNGGSDFPEISIESLNLSRALRFVEKKQYEELAEYVSQAICNLEKGGAQVVALTAATMHIVYDMVAENVRTPFISIPETAAEYAFSKGYRRVGLLGTIFTMEKDYLSKAFINKGIEVIVPNPDIRVLVNERISKELEYGIVKESTVEELQNVILNMKNEHGIEAVILGCTELPLAINEGISPVPCIDIMEIHIQRLVELIR